MHHNDSAFDKKAFGDEFKTEFLSDLQEKQFQPL